MADLITKSDVFPKPKHGIPVWARTVLDVYRKTGKLSKAYASVMGLKRSDVAQLMLTNAEFAEEWSDIKEEQVEQLKEAMMERAIKGVKEPVFYKGEEVAKVRKPSDTLAMFMLKGLDSETFGDKRSISVTNRHIRVDVRRFDEQGVEIFGEDHDVNPDEVADQSAQEAAAQTADGDDPDAPRVTKQNRSLTREAQDVMDVEINDPDDDLDDADDELRQLLGQDDSCPFV